MRRLAAALAALLVLGALAASAAEAPAPELRVRLRPVAAAAGPLVRLDEVADLSGARAGEAAGVLLGRAPQAGQSRAITARAVGLRLEEEGFDARRVEVSGAAETMVGPFAPAPAGKAVKAEPVPADQRLQTLAVAWVRAALAERLGCPADDVDVKLEGLSATGVAGDLQSLKARVEWAAERARLGHQKVTILLSSGGGPRGRLEAYADAAVLRTVLVAARDLAAGRPLAPEDVAEARLRLADLSAGHLTDASQVAGQVLARALKAGAPLDSRALARQVLVRRGQPVQLVSESAGLKITETVIARSDGALGDPVVVERPGSRKQLAGKVADKGLVKVE